MAEIGLLDYIKTWMTASLLGVMISLHLLWQCIRKGFTKVLHWEQWERPACLDDPKYGTHGFVVLKDDVRIHYVASGPEDKPLMLFVHGCPEFWFSWKSQILEFQRDYRVVAMDMRGYGESSKPVGMHNYVIDKLMADVDQVIQGLGYKSCVLVAHDWGGLVAWTFAKHYPDRVDKLIILNAPPGPVFSKVLKTSKSQAQKSWYMSFFQLPYLPELMFKSNNFGMFDDMIPKRKNSEDSETAEKMHKEQVAAYKYAFSQPGALTPIIDYYRARFRLASTTSSFEHDLEYNMPVLLIWGCKDQALDIVIPNTVEETAPKIDVKRLPEAPHWVQTDSPDEVNKLMRDWLKNQ